MYRILAIEDDPIIQKVLVITLKAEGMETLVAPDGSTGIALALGERPDLVLLDIHLPDMSGFEVCRKLKESADTRHIPVIILSGEARETSHRIEGLDSGAEDYLLKPVSSRVLAARVRAILKIATRPT
jgi:two-component system phosphate regulon response regulator PhoB